MIQNQNVGVGHCEGVWCVCVCVGCVSVSKIQLMMMDDGGKAATEYKPGQTGWNLIENPSPSYHLI